MIDTSKGATQVHKVLTVVFEDDPEALGRLFASTVSELRDFMRREGVEPADWCTITINILPAGDEADAFSGGAIAGLLSATPLHDSTTDPQSRR